MLVSLLLVVLFAKLLKELCCIYSIYKLVSYCFNLCQVPYLSVHFESSIFC